MSIGLGLLLAPIFREGLGRWFSRVIALASAGLIANMAVAIYVHLQPEVPAGVLPLGIRPPFIPLSFMLLAALNLFAIYRTDADHVHASGDPHGSTSRRSRGHAPRDPRRVQCS
jgi:hypothetical protein